MSAARTLESLRSQLTAIRAQVDAVLSVLDGAAAAPTTDTVNLEAATVMLGSRRKARGFFARAEREGFAVRRMGHAVMMDRAEWDRALVQLATKRAPPPADDSPAALLEHANLKPRSR